MDLDSEDALRESLTSKLSSGASPVEPVVAAAVVPEPVVEPVVEPVIEPTPTEEPVVAEVPAQPTEEEASGRFRLKGKLAAVAQLTKEGMSEDEAIERVYGKAAEAPALEPVIDPVATLETELAEVQKTLNAAAEDQSLLTPDVMKAFDRKAEIREAIRDAKQQKSNEHAAQVQTEQQKFDAGWEASEAWVKSHYAEALVPDSPLNVAVAKDIETIGNDPRHPLFGNANLPKILYAQHAADLGLSPKTAPAKTPTTRMLPASGGVKTNPAPIVNEAVIAQELQSKLAKAADEGDYEEMARLTYEKGFGKSYKKRDSLQLA